MEDVQPKGEEQLAEEDEEMPAEDPEKPEEEDEEEEGSEQATLSDFHLHARQERFIRLGLAVGQYSSHRTIWHPRTTPNLSGNETVHFIMRPPCTITEMGQMGWRPR